MEFTLNLTLNSLVGFGSDFMSNNVFPLTTKTVSPYGAQQFAGACWQCYFPGPAPFFLPTALSGTPGVVLTAAGQTIMSVNVSNSYESNPNLNGPATYSWPGLTFAPPYSGTITQDVTPSGMVLVTISVSC